MERKKPQSQASLADQLNELEKLAIENGLYDAHDWIVNRRTIAMLKRQGENGR